MLLIRVPADPKPGDNENMRIAAISYCVNPVSSPDAFIEHHRRLLERCALSHVDLAVFPENTSFELLGEKHIEEKDAVAHLVNHPSIPRLRALFAEFSRRTGMTIIGGTHLEMGHNVAWQVKGGEVIPQTKNKMTVYERDVLGIKAGSKLTPLSETVGTLICYDSEFPEAGRSLAENGCRVLCVPAFTETDHGFYRVRNSCLARATENQIIVVHASLIGGIGREPMPHGNGSSAILAPSIEPYPETGIIAETQWNEESLAIADIDLDELLEARSKGDVRNWDDRAADCWAI